MKVSDFIKITEDNTEIALYTSWKHLYCTLAKESDFSPVYDCEDYNADENSCQHCELSDTEVTEFDNWRGFAREVPIKFADKKVLGVKIYEYTETLYRGRKEIKNTKHFLGLLIEKE